jgi:hypothetical protein
MAKGRTSRDLAPGAALAGPVTLRSYEPHDFSALYRLDQACFPAGISYSKTMLNYFLKLPSADCLVATEVSRIVGTALLGESERNLSLRGVRTILLETAIENEVAIAFWQRHGYGIEAMLKRYYLGRLDAYEMRKRLVPPKSAPHPGEKN